MHLCIRYSAGQFDYSTQVPGATETVMCHVYFSGMCFQFTEGWEPVIMFDGGLTAITGAEDNSSGMKCMRRVADPVDLIIRASGITDDLQVTINYVAEIPYC